MSRRLYSPLGVVPSGEKRKTAMDYAKELGVAE